MSLRESFKLAGEAAAEQNFGHYIVDGVAAPPKAPELNSDQPEEM